MREEHYVELRGKKHVLYSGLLAMAHERGISSIDEEIVQIPTEENEHLAIVKATVTDGDGRTFVGIGDASPQSVSKNIAVHSLRMASTRAKARALRDWLNVGAEILEDATEEDQPEPLRALPNELASQQQQGYIKGLLKELGRDRARFEGKNGAISTFSPEKASKAIDLLQKALDKKHVEGEVGS